LPTEWISHVGNANERLGNGSGLVGTFLLPNNIAHHMGAIWNLRINCQFHKQRSHLSSLPASEANKTLTALCT